MNRIISLFFLVLLILGCNHREGDVNVSTDESYLIEAADLKKIIDRPNIKIVNFTSPAVYAKEHIVNAVNIDRKDVEDDSHNYKGVMATRKQVESLFGNLGISDEDTIVVYDDNGLCNASRLWWILQNYNFTQVKLLHGGLLAWKEIGGEVTNKDSQLKKTIFKLPQNASMKYYISKENVEAALGQNSILVDTRTNDEFTGKRQKNGALKGGRIPGAVHVDWAEAIRYGGDKRMKSRKELDSIYSNLGINKNDEIILYCHTGMRSAHTTFVLTQLLGYKKVKNYDGSWVEWSHFNDLPTKKDSLTLIH